MKSNRLQRNQNESETREELVSLTKELISFRTVRCDQKEFEDAFSYIINYFSDTELEIFEHEKEDFKTLVAATDEDPEIMLHGHVDVVDADEEMFEPIEKDGRIYGRGSADMKSGLACLMKAMKNLPEDSSVGLMIVSDEEIGGFRGAQYLMQKGVYNPDFALSAEPRTQGEQMEIVTDQKGIMRIVISAECEGAHGSRPWEGENAAEKLWEKFEEVKENFRIEKDSWNSTVNLGYFNADGAMNVVPDYAEAGLDVRYTEEYPPEEIVADLKQIEDLDFEVEAKDPALKTSRENEKVQRLKKKAENHSEIDFSREKGASDMRHFSQQGIAAVVIGPKGGNIHGQDEYVEKESMEKFYKIIHEFVSGE